MTPAPPPAPPTVPPRRAPWARLAFAVTALVLVAGVAWMAVQTASGVRIADERVDRWAAGSEAALRRVPLLTDAETALLRRSLNACHVALAESLGVAPPDTLGGSPAGLVRVDTLASARVLDGTHSDPLLTPDGARTLRLVAREFRTETVQAGVPPVRPVATSLLRSAASQAALRRVNANAAAGRSSHEYGTTFDLSYRRFEPVAPGVTVQPGESPGFHGAQLVVPARVPRLIRPLVREAVARRAARHAARLVADYPSRYAALLGRAIIGLEDAGLLVALRESRQTVYHVTAARHAAGPTCGTQPTPD